MSSKKQTNSLHFFPPNPFKIGDCILTFDIAIQLAKSYKVLYYYCSKTIAEILMNYGIKGIKFVIVRNITESFIIAHRLRNDDLFNVKDLQQLNCYIDFPEFRYLFDSEISYRCKKEWDDPGLIKQYGLNSFSNIFREILSIPKESIQIPSLSMNRTNSNYLLLFPHADTPFQQISFWPEIYEITKSYISTTIVGREIVKRIFKWPTGTIFQTDLSGSEIVTTIGGSMMAIGGATGLTHVAAACNIPTAFLWNFDDSVIFKPVNEKKCVHIKLEKTNKEKAIENIECFIIENLCR